MSANKAQITEINEFSNKRVAILGAGLLGRMLAVALSQPSNRDFQITLFDKDNQQGSQSAAYLAAAMLAPLSESAEASLTVKQMGEHALNLWPNFLQQLAKPVFFQQAGSLILAHEQDRSSLADFKRRLKTEHIDEVQVVNLHDINALEADLQPHAKRFSDALFLPKEGQLDNRQLLDSLAATMQQRSVKWHSNTDIDFAASPTLKDQLMQDYDWVVDCRGLGAKEALPATEKLRGVRGEVIRVYAPDVNITRPVRLMHPRYPIYIAPKENHHFVVGATQIESEDKRQPTVRSSLELLSSCFSVHPGFAEAEVLEIRAGLRPALEDNEPRLWQENNYISMNGLYRHGYLLAPTLIEQCLAILDNQAQQAPFYEKLVAPQRTNIQEIA